MLSMPRKKVRKAWAGGSASRPWATLWTVDHRPSVLKGPAEDGLQAHPPVRGEEGGFQLVQVEVLEVGGDAPFPFLHGPLRAEEAWPFCRSLHGSLPSKNPYRKPGRSHQPKAGG
jgi:hypothetical protein